jgi:hypothetical protein
MRVRLQLSIPREHIPQQPQPFPRKRQHVCLSIVAMPRINLPAIRPPIRRRDGDKRSPTIPPY